jgi:hypothetical protein
MTDDSLSQPMSGQTLQTLGEAIHQTAAENMEHWRNQVRQFDEKAAAIGKARLAWLKQHTVEKVVEQWTPPELSSTRAAEIAEVRAAEWMEKRSRHFCQHLPAGHPWTKKGKSKPPRAPKGCEGWVWDSFERTERRKDAGDEPKPYSLLPLDHFTKRTGRALETCEKYALLAAIHDVVMGLNGEAINPWEADAFDLAVGEVGADDDDDRGDDDDGPDLAGIAYSVLMAEVRMAAVIEKDVEDQDRGPQPLLFERDRDALKRFLAEIETDTGNAGAGPVNTAVTQTGDRVIEGDEGGRYTDVCNIALDRVEECIFVQFEDGPNNAWKVPDIHAKTCGRTKVKESTTRDKIRNLIEKGVLRKLPNRGGTALSPKGKRFAEYLARKE